tara:strand:- start:1613 stop:2125 length:513 start_codon:yes stop_codon:yes gene_type:complete
MNYLEAIVDKKITSIKDFLSNEESNNFIDYHKKQFNLNRPFCNMHRTTEVIQCMDILGNPVIKKMYKKLNNFVQEINPDLMVNYFQIVHWPTDEFQVSHLDFDYHPYTSIIYLNDDFEGGATRIDDTFISPKKNMLVSFEGNSINHEVLKIKKGERYTLPCWYTLGKDGK